MAARVFQVCDSDSAGVVKMNILHCSLRDLRSARRLNSCCSTGAAQPPMLDSRGWTWQPLMCESVKCGVLFFTFSQSNPGGKLAVIECLAHLRDLTPPPPPQQARRFRDEVWETSFCCKFWCPSFFLVNCLLPFHTRSESSAALAISHPAPDEARRALAFVI